MEKYNHQEADASAESTPALVSVNQISEGCSKSVTFNLNFIQLTKYKVQRFVIIFSETCPRVSSSLPPNINIFMSSRELVEPFPKRLNVHV